MCVFEKTRERGKEGREGRKAYRIENHWRHKNGAKRERRGRGISPVYMDTLNWFPNRFNFVRAIEID